jgi:predicted O-methyltransferase YrrM
MLLIKNKSLRQVLGILETANVLGLKLWLKNARNARLFPGIVFRSYMSLAGDEKWACKEIFDIVEIPEGARIVIEHMHGQGISTPVEELAYMALIARALDPKRIFEIGTFRGRTALNFALNTSDDCRICTLDLPPDDRAEATRATGKADTAIIQGSVTGADYKGKDVAHKIEQLFGDSSTFDFGPYRGRMDLVFVDGAHHYEAVYSDTKNALAMCRPGGLILWHDFANYGDYNDVTRAVLDMLPGDRVIQIANTQLAAYRSG